MELSPTDLHVLWRLMRFPAAGTAPALNLIRSDSAEAAEYVTTIDAFMRTGVYRLSSADVMTFLDEIVDQFDELHPDLARSDQKVAREMRAYALFLSLLYGAFVEVGFTEAGSRRPSRGSVAGDRRPPEGSAVPMGDEV